MVKNDKDIQPQKRKALKYGLIGLIAFFLIYHSFDVVPLDSRRHDDDEEDVAQRADAYFLQSLPEVLANAPEPCTLLAALSQKDQDWASYGKQTNIGNRYYFLIRGEGSVQEIQDSYVQVAFGEGEQVCSLRVATVYIFGNEIRDASGKLALEDVGELTKFNAISERLNKRVREEIIPEFLGKVQVGQKIRFAGAFALNRRLGVTDDFEVMPVQLQIVD
ncbi:DUF2291 family protein [Sphingobacterium sp. SGR-19]|uniref:DUF2291 family protein n=1 Tax=Sphingobacterium sp. SGR-19 TaxID=2710886 RepID=UPI0013EAB14C|nr:DUF2291 family protein [Sphingobacterium sp. SGR-19]NGM64507.1 DUF2291 domain-containing protein [Sphingobacterium sp. SGR-19]